jgi:Zn-dependent protease
VKINVLMFVFNLFPLPPLDGGRILVGLLPMRQAVAVSRVEPWGFFIVLALVFSGLANTFWMQPLKMVTYWLLGLLLSPFSMIFG